MTSKQIEPSHPDLILLESMLNDLVAYRSRRRNFPQFLSSLDIGISSLGGEITVARELRNLWRKLEEINAMALDQGQLHPLEEDMLIANDAVLSLESCLNEAISSFSQ